MNKSLAEKIEVAAAPKLVALANTLPVRALLRRTTPAPGRGIDPGVRLLVVLRQLLGGSLTQARNIPAARKRISRHAQLHAGKPTPVAEVVDYQLPLYTGTHPARLYVPHGADAEGPLLVYAHGGGFVIGDIAMFDATCRLLASASKQRVLSIEYALAPEHPCPAAAEDGYAALRWAQDNAVQLGTRPEWISIGGDSAGGNLAAVVCQRAVAEGGIPPLAQLLIYPAVDRTYPYPSLDRFAQGFMLTKEDVEWYHQQYTGQSGLPVDDPRVSPLRGNLAGVAPAMVLTVSLDPLCEEGDAYAVALQAAGVTTTHLQWEGLVHGFINLIGPSPVCRRQVQELGERWAAFVDAQRSARPTL